MSHAEERPEQPHNDFLVVRQRIAEEQARVRTENLVHADADATQPAGEAGRPGRARAWLGRRLVAIGTVLTADPPVPEPRSTTGQPC